MLIGFWAPPSMHVTIQMNTIKKALSLSLALSIFGDFKGIFLKDLSFFYVGTPRRKSVGVSSCFFFSKKHINSLGKIRQSGP